MASDDIGTRLRSAREARGVSLKEIALRTKISVSALEALERQDLHRLPGGIFGRAFVRAYAIEVGLDPETTVETFLVEKARQERERASARARPEVTKDDREFLARQERAMRTLRMAIAGLAILVIGGTAAVSMWYWPSHDEVKPPAPATEPAADKPPPIESGAPPPAAAPAAAPVPDGLVIEIETTDDCWVQATADGLVVLSRLMRAGDRERLEAGRELILDAGSAGAIKWSINGKDAKPLGRAGVHRQVRITRENFAEFLQ